MSRINIKLNANEWEWLEKPTNNAVPLLPIMKCWKLWNAFCYWAHEEKDEISELWSFPIGSASFTHDLNNKNWKIQIRSRLNVDWSHRDWTIAKVTFLDLVALIRKFFAFVTVEKKNWEKKVFSDFNDFRTHNFFYVLCVVHESNVERGLRRKLIILWSWSWANAEFGGKKSLGSSSRHPRVPYNLRDIIINCWFALLTFLNRFLRYLRSSWVVVAAVLIGTSSMLWFFASVSPYAWCCKVDKMCPEVVKELLCCSSQWELIH